jgi:inorganic pyrophosphatase
MNLLHDIEVSDREGIYNMIVENPSGVSTKYEVNKKYGVIGLDRFLHIPMAFPFEYGFMPHTWNKSDDDPVDVMVLLSGSTFVGCLLEVKIIGMYKLIDTGEEDNKVLSVCAHDTMFKDIDNLDELPNHYINKIEFFWAYYKKLTPNKETEGKGWASKSTAIKYVDKSINYYNQIFDEEGNRKS